jgi:hypothetical protein
MELYDPALLFTRRKGYEKHATSEGLTTHRLLLPCPHSPRRR